MPQWVHCPKCDQHYQFPDAAAGKQVHCPKCATTLTVSGPAPAAMPIPPAPRIPFAPEPAEEPMWALPVPSEERRSATRADPDRSRRPPAIPVAPLPPRAPVPEPPNENLPATAGDNPTAYYHAACGGTTTFSPDVAARITGDPFGFIPATWCAKCRRHVGLRAVTWQGTRETLAAYRARLRRQMHPSKILMRLVGGPLIVVLLLAGVGALANANERLLGALAGVAIGIPLGLFVTGVAFQISWGLARRKKGGASAGEQSPAGGGG